MKRVSGERLNTAAGWIASVSQLATRSTCARIAVCSCVLAVACSNPEFKYRDEGSKKTTTTTTSGMGAGGMTSSSGGGGMTSSSSGGCTLGKIGDCPDENGSARKCTVLNVDTAQVGCNHAGPKRVWQKCIADADCEDGTWCDLEFKVASHFATAPATACSTCRASA